MPARAGRRAADGAGARAALLERRKPFFTGLARFGVGKALYLQDPFHTLLNLPWWKFIIIFFSTYVLQFCTFALVYLAFPNTCTHGIDGNFGHALWMSSRTASTIGFNQIYPEVTCPGANLVVMLQVICSNLIDFIMLGLVFARFSAPFKRATSIRFTKVATIARHVSGYWALTFRIANIRKHQLIKPEVRVMVTATDSITPSNFAFEYLDVEALDMQQMNLQLGFPANVTHVIRPGSPLWNLSLQEMDARMMEVLVFLDGVDAMTSKVMQARRSYEPQEMLLNEQFEDLHLEMRGGKLGLDFSHFDTTRGSTDELVNQYQTSPALAGMSMPELQSHMSQLRHLTFKRLTEQLPGGAAARSKQPPGAVGASAGGTGSGVVGLGAAAAAAAAAAGIGHNGGTVELGRVAAGATGSGGGGRPAGAAAQQQRDASNPFDQSPSQFHSLPL